MINTFSLEDPRILAHWVHIHINDKPCGIAKDMQVPNIYGMVQHVAVMVSAGSITVFRRQRKDLKYTDIDINHVDRVLPLKGYISPEQIAEFLGVPVAIGEEVWGVWQGITTLYDRIPLLAYDAA